MQIHNNVYYSNSMPGSCVSYLITDKTNGSTFIDTGFFPFMEKLVKEAKIEFSDVKNIVITHTHPDHTHSVERIRDMSGARVYSHRNGEYKDIRETMPPGIEKLIDDYVEENDILPILSGAKVLHTPGHTSNHISLLLEKEGILFSGDALQYRSEKFDYGWCGFYGNYGFNLDNEQAKQSYQRLIKMLSDLEIKILCPGHRKPIETEEITKALERYNKQKPI